MYLKLVKKLRFLMVLAVLCVYITFLGLFVSDVVLYARVSAKDMNKPVTMTITNASPVLKDAPNGKKQVAFVLYAGVDEEQVIEGDVASYFDFLEGKREVKVYKTTYGSLITPRDAFLNAEYDLRWCTKTLAEPISYTAGFFFCLYLIFCLVELRSNKVTILPRHTYHY